MSNEKQDSHERLEEKHELQRKMSAREVGVDPETSTWDHIHKEKERISRAENAGCPKDASFDKIMQAEYAIFTKKRDQLYGIPEGAERREIRSIIKEVESTNDGRRKLKQTLGLAEDLPWGNTKSIIEGYLSLRASDVRNPEDFKRQFREADEKAKRFNDYMDKEQELREMRSNLKDIVKLK